MPIPLDQMQLEINQLSIDELEETSEIITFSSDESNRSSKRTSSAVTVKV